MLVIFFHIKSVTRKGKFGYFRQFHPRGFLSAKPPEIWPYDSVWLEKFKFTDVRKKKPLTKKTLLSKIAAVPPFTFYNNAKDDRSLPITNQDRCDKPSKTS